ncbi:hypothetical protein ACQ4M4_12955 [Leptolyngbya sp. AN02str]|uniref:hypothetical protein n=1 Tax=Leptolyngbya sp. AN02str TaxID=3423363 RepID=UPI003D315886
MVDYLDSASCLDEVKTNPSVRGLAGVEYDSYLTNQLMISAGMNAEVQTVYRPYYVAAKFLEQLRSQQTVSKADGADFTGLAKPIESLLGLQASLDKAMGLTISDGFEAILPDCQVCENKLGGASRYRTRSHTPTMRP